jgi:branched-chain amino acid transport system substrate-binding protein
MKFLGLAAVVAFVIASSAADAQNQDPIRIGVSLAASGPVAQVGAPTLKGIRMAAEEINNKGGILGRKIELVTRDTKGNADEAVRVSRELILKENVDFLLGGTTSAEAPAVSTIAKENKIVFFAVIAGLNSLTSPANLHPYAFRSGEANSAEGRAAAEVVAKWPVKRLATISPDYGYGQEVTKAFVDHLKQIKPDVEIVDQQWPKFGEPDFTPFVNAQLAKKPEAVFSSVWAGDFATFVKQAKPLGYFSAIQNNFIAVGGSGSIENLKSMSAEYPVGIWANAFDVFNWDSGPEEHKEYVERLRRFTGEQYPPSWSIMGYVPMLFLAEAIKKAGDTNSDKVANALLGLTVDTPLGPMTIRPKDHETGRGKFYGKVITDPKYPFPVLSEITYVVAKDY